MSNESNPLKQAYEIARANPGKMTILTNSQDRGISIDVHDVAPVATSERKELFGAENDTAPGSKPSGPTP